MNTKIKYCPYCQRETIHRPDMVNGSPVCNVCDSNAQKKGMKIMFFSLLVFIAIIIGIMMLSSCASSGPRNYTTSYDTCPTYPSVKHNRAHSKRINPKYCNRVNHKPKSKPFNY